MKMIRMATRSWLLVGVVFALSSLSLGACAPSYMKPSELEQSNLGPKQCAARCDELGLRMGALVLVPGALPGCVCQPKRQDKDKAPGNDAAQDSATATSAAQVVVVDAAAVKKEQQDKEELERE